MFYVLFVKIIFLCSSSIFPVLIIKDEPTNSPTQNVLFIKITVSFTSLIPSLILPTDDREKTERTP